MRKFVIFAGLSLGLATFVSVASAQQTTTPTPQGGAQGAEQQRPFERRGGHRRHMGGMGREHGLGLRGLRRLNLSEAQQGQIRSIHDAARQRTQAQREELRQLFESRRGGGQLTAEQQARAQQLMSELRAAHEGVNTEVLGVLTTEQRAQLEQWKQERESRRQQMRGRHAAPGIKEQ